jgi:hypothetical protein
LSLPFSLPGEKFVCISHLLHAWQMPRLSHAPWADHPNNIWWRVKVMKLFIRVVASIPTLFRLTGRQNKCMQHLGRSLLQELYPVIDSQPLTHEGYQDLLVNV